LRLRGYPAQQVRIWTSSALDPMRNLLLASLGVEDLRTLARHLEPVSLEYREVLYHPGEALSHVYFPVSGLVSILAVSATGATVEVGPVGRDGMVGLPIYLGSGTDPLQASAQIPPCLALRIAADCFREATERIASLERIMRLYVQWTYASMAQWVLCARLHPIEERLARWLLMCHERVLQDTFPLTHEFLAQMLGVRRATVTLAAGSLERAGLVLFRRGLVTIADRPALEDAACECHRVLLAEYARLFGRAPG
jgi:CRP-like cAMP-binding protein